MKNMQTSIAIDMEYLDVKVTKSGTCYGYDYDLEWTQTSGDLPTLSVSRLLVRCGGLTILNVVNSMKGTEPLLGFQFYNILYKMVICYF